MLKIITLILYFFFYNTSSYGYLDPVTTGIIYQILFFLFAGFITFFTKIGKLLKFINKDYKYSENILLLLCIFPFWILLSNLNFNETLIAFTIFLITPLVIFFLLKKIFSTNKKILIVLTSFVTVYGLDHALGLTSIINLFRIIDDITRYACFALLFIILTIIISFIYHLNKRTINFFIIIIIFSNVFNLINGEKDIYNIKKHELKEKYTPLTEINSDYKKINPTIVIILDEFNGFKVLNDEIKNTKETKNVSENFFKKFNFKHYPNAYTIYASTVDSIPSYLNFYDEYNYLNLKKFREPYENSFAFYEKITSNKLFDLFNPNKIYIHQTLTLDICAYENYKKCKTLNPFSKNNKYINNFTINSLEFVFSKYSYQSSIVALLLTRTLRFFDLIKIIEPRMIGKMTVKQVLDDLFNQSKTKQYSLILAHIMAPHKPFAWDKNNCKYKFYQNQNFLTKEKKQEIHNIEIQCMIKYLDVFVNNLEKNKLLNYYNIIITSDHGARNLDYKQKGQDWHSTFYIERKINSLYQKKNEVTNVQNLFYNFFHENKKVNTNNKYYDSYDNTYKIIN